jgi:hypothetical protein
MKPFRQRLLSGLNFQWKQRKVLALLDSSWLYKGTSSWAPGSLRGPGEVRFSSLVMQAILPDLWGTVRAWEKEAVLI